MTKFVENAWMNPTVWLVSRRLADLAGPWDERLSGSGDDDGEYICRVVSTSERVKFVPEATCYYRIGNFGSQNWMTSKNLEAFFLVLSLSINHLLSLEDSERTRSASLRYLQNWISFFYPDKHELLSKIHALAGRLGGELGPPEINWKYYLIEKIFGWNTAIKVRDNWRKTKLVALKNFDRLLFSDSRH